MKKIFVLLLCTLVLVSLFGSTVTYADDYGYFCKSEDSIVIKVIDFTELTDAFTVPKGYYVKVVGLNNRGYYEVEYSGVKGYVEKSVLDAIEKTTSPEKPYFSFKLEVEATADVYKFPDFTTNAIKVGDSQVYYLGKIVKDEVNYYAVKLGESNDLYYLKESLVLNRNALNEALNPVKVPTGSGSISTTVSGDSSEPESVNKTAVRVVLIIGIIVPALIIVFLVFKPSKRRSKQQRRVDADDSDSYEDY